MTTATEMRDKYIIAEAAILEGKEVHLGDRRLKMEDLDQVIAGRKEWEQRVTMESAAAARVPTFGGKTFAFANFAGD